MLIRPLHRKLLRELGVLRWQAITIALVVACGIAGFVTMQSNAASITWSRDRYYASHRFGDVFVNLRRAPEAVARRLEEVQGVSAVETRVSETILLPLPELGAPATGLVVSVPAHGQEPRFGALYVREGRLPEPGRADEVVVHEAFAKTHHLRPGATLPAVMNGIRHELAVVGIALSPEFVFPVAGGVITDDRRFAVLWMDRTVLSDAFQMQGAFNDVVLGLRPGAKPEAVTAAVDRVLAPHGGLGARGRDRQPSNQVLDSELKGLRSFATAAPLVFLAVAAFLIHVVLSRIVQLQRGEIATLKAVGYDDGEVGRHYLQLVLVISLGGAALGFGLGAWLGKEMLGIYEEYFRFPTFTYRLDFGAVGVSVALSVGAAVVGGLSAVRRVSRLPPAEAMQPEAPATFRRGLLEVTGLGRVLPPTWKIVLRSVARHPVRALLTSVGIAFSMAVLVTARVGDDAFETLLDLAFQQARRDDLAVTFREPQARKAERELAHLPGVLATEPERMVGVRMRVGPRFRDVALVGHPAGATLSQLVQFPREVVPVPEEGVLLTDKLAEVLGATVGGTVWVEVLEGDRRVRELPVVGTVSELFGLSGHLRLEALNRVLGEEAGVANAVRLRVDEPARAELEERLSALPAVASIDSRENVMERMRQQSGESMGTTTLILTLFGVTLAIGVVYNQARIALSTRSRELASLRVLGFTRREVAGVLLGELALEVAVAVPMGLALGAWLTDLIMSGVDQELYRLPASVSPGTYAFAFAVTIAAALVSALLVKRRLDRVDIVSALKTRE